MGSEYVRGMRDAAAMLNVSRQTTLLAAGEMTAGEMRTCRAMTAWHKSRIERRADELARTAPQHDDAQGGGK